MLLIWNLYFFLLCGTCIYICFGSYATPNMYNADEKCYVDLGKHYVGDLLNVRKN